MKMNKVFFLVVPRSGSSILSFMLQVASHNLLQMRQNPNHCQLNKETCTDFLYFIEPFGIAPLIRNFQSDERCCLINLLKSDRFRFVYLTRRNSLKHALSFCMVKNTGVWHTSDKNYKENITSISEEDIKIALLEVAKNNALAELFFQRHNINPLRIYYEDDLEHQECAEHLRQKLESFLGQRIMWNLKIASERKKLAGDERENFYRSLLDEAS